MMFITALVSLLLTAVITEGQVCSRVVDDSVYGLESDSASVRLGYAAVSSRVQTAMKSQGGIAAKSQSQRCAVSKTASVSSSLRHPWGRTCEACPPRVYYLRRFLRYCYVAQWPFKQQIRYVRCPYRCNQPCWCSNSRCVATRHSLVWVWAYCTRSTSLGFVRGINYRWLWLPQDCQCRES
ncbi:uncharacterized protein LOC124122958 [Haliotis rufescens]|uniref:uncharacterized protein LOC124122958 n=1 Tax=Haliotis rufescens TaxID=6454 RepID=UPI00201EDEB1|nr:uncharacterized protein LOC124122958 [Haliotis rufescens]